MAAGGKKRPVLQAAAVQSADIYRCCKCGKKTEAPKGVFPFLPKSSVYSYNQGYAHICLDCVEEMTAELEDRYHDQKTAYVVMCHYLDVFFDDVRYEEMKFNKDFSFKSYFSSLNRGTGSKTFLDNLEGMVLTGAFTKSEAELEEAQEAKWSAGDNRNKNYVISTVGYDPFRDTNLTQFDQRYLYNTCVDYLSDDVVEDPHRVQCVLELVHSLLQQDKVNRLIMEEHAKARPDPKRLKDLVDIKRDYSNVVSTIANENGISLKGSGKTQKGSNTLTKIMKDMADNGFEDCKANFVTAKMSESFYEVERASMKAIQDELNLQPDEYASLLSEQSVLLAQLQEEVASMKEENRLLKVKISGG
ncbi:MAG: hypothetical protein J6S14_17340 [Clostridia bacterium]|nr:hypothetical protein [Clostridia bacterium]